MIVVILILTETQLQVKAGLDMIIADEVGIVAKTLKQMEEPDN